MSIGVDMDDTICRTTEIVHSRLEEYSKQLGINPLDIMNDEELKGNFFAIYGEDIYKNAEIKRNVSDVIKRLRKKGNEIYLITSREDNFKTTKISAFEITRQWLAEHEIVVDAIVTSVYGETRAELCKKYNIDLMIDDDPYNYKKIISMGKQCLLFDDREKYALKENYVTNWLDIEKYIERNH